MGVDEVVIISGPPGSGKSTIAKALAAEAALGVHLESDWFFRFIKGGFVAPHLPPAHDQNTVVVDVTVDCAARYAAGGYSVFWDGIVGPWFLDQVIEGLAAHGLRSRYLVLRPPREVALARVRERDGTTDVSGAETMYDQFADLGAYESHVIESNIGPTALLAQCGSALFDDTFLTAKSSA